MILNILLSYLALGIFLNLIDPVKKVINEEVIKISFENLSRTAHGSNPISERKIFIFKIILILGTILFWPFLLPGICKKYKNSTKPSIYEYPENTSKDEKEKRGYLGVATQDMTKDLWKEFGVDTNKGAIITQVQEESPADIAGIKTGDVVTKINNQSVKNTAALRNKIELLKLNSVISMQINRKGEIITKKVKIYEKEVGINFRWMNGHGTISCWDCEFSQEFTAFTHGYSENESGLRFPCSTSGFQCQSCGKFTTRKRIEPFVKSVWDETFEELPDEERADRIEHMKSMKEMCERNMKETPKEQWLETWESTVTEYTKVLNTVPPEELKAVKEKREEFKRQYAASLFCDENVIVVGYENFEDWIETLKSRKNQCGGRLEQEKILFCPSCKSKNLEYDMRYMT